MTEPTRALITGGAGFIGSNLADALLDRGREVTVVDNFVTGRRRNLDAALARGARLHELDITDAEALRDVMTRTRPDVVFHLAAQIDVRLAVEDPVFDAQINVAGTASVLEAARAAGVRRVVLASTGGAIYGETDRVPSDESAPLAPLAPYGASKAGAELYMALWHRLHGMSTLSLRLANVYGPRQDPKGEAGVIAIFSGRAAEGGEATVFGDGLQSRDYVYVGDVAEAFMLAGESDATGELNIGTGVETTVLELARTLGVSVAHAPARAGEVQRSCLNAGRAAEVLGWRARTPLAEGLARTLAAAPAEAGR